jgi:hypothetical protein
MSNERVMASPSFAFAVVDSHLAIATAAPFRVTVNEAYTPLPKRVHGNETLHFRSFFHGVIGWCPGQGSNLYGLAADGF